MQTRSLHIKTYFLTKRVHSALFTSKIAFIYDFINLFNDYLQLMP